MSNITVSEAEIIANQIHDAFKGKPLSSMLPELVCAVSANVRSAKSQDRKTWIRAIEAKLAELPSDRADAEDKIVLQAAHAIGDLKLAERVTARFEARQRVKAGIKNAAAELAVIEAEPARERYAQQMRKAAAQRQAIKDAAWDRNFDTEIAAQKAVIKEFFHLSGTLSPRNQSLLNLAFREISKLRILKELAAEPS